MTMTHRGAPVTLAFPPFTGAVKWLVLSNAAVFLFMLLLRPSYPLAAGYFTYYLALLPAAVAQGFVWQLLTYSFLHAGLFHLLFNMLMLWMFGSQIEDLLRRRRFLEFYFFCVAAAAVVTVLFSFLGLLGMSPMAATVGASGGVFGILMAFAMIYGERQIFMFPFPFMIKAKYMVAILAFIQVAGALSQTGNIAYLAHLGGLVAGWVYIKFMPRGGLTRGLGDLWLEWRNAYYRYKRRRAARKFEVYMRKHNRTVYFDEQGNYIGPEPPQDDRPNDSGRPPWVN
jgi:membrane associated rhomboid family serine protease